MWCIIRFLATILSLLVLCVVAAMLWGVFSSMPLWLAAIFAVPLVLFGGASVYMFRLARS